ncbi:hypothetical protein evm_005833 [Chilo suppressalis]|nr:hypothetical protein evm_005833 [Chilo suppressalis]
MSEQEKTGGESVPVVVVEQTAPSRHKPYRPTELQEEANPDMHKRSRAPAVPSVKEELKDTTANDITGAPEYAESARVTSEKQSHPSKKLSSTKRKGSTPEDIAMVLLDAQKDNIASVPQPIPDHDTVMSKESIFKPAEKAGREKTADDDSITEEISELRTSEPAKEHSEWTEQPTHSSAVKKKEIKWEDSEYLDKIHLQNMGANSQVTLLERKASVGPCFKPNMLYGGPSGITVCVPKKSVRNMKEDFNPIQSVINFNVTKKMESKSAPHVEARYQRKKAETQKQKNTPKIQEKELKIESHPKFFDAWKGKIGNMTSKIKNLLNI